SLAAHYIVGHVKELIILATEEGAILQVNPTAVRLLGWGDAELVGRALPDLYYLPDTGQPEWPFPGCSLATAVEHDAVFHTRAGEELPVAVTCSYLRDGYGDVVGIVVIGADQRPTQQLRHEIRERADIEEQLRRAHDTLELLVEQRTEELARTNAELIEEIAERERAEQALRRSEEKYRGLFEHMNEGANICEVVRDDAGRVVDWIIREINPALEKTAQVGAGASLGRRASAVLGPARLARYLPFVSHVVTAHQPIQFEAYSPELRKHLVLSLFEVQPEHFAMVSMDITERKEAMQHLRESEEKYRGLFEHMNEGMTLNALRYDAHGALTDWTVLEANYAITQIIGLPPSQIVGRGAHELFGAAQVQALLPVMAAAAEGRAPQVFEYYHPRLLRHLLISLFATGPDRVAMVAMDITERKQAEEALRAREAELRAMFNAPMGLSMLLDAAGTIMAINEPGAQRFGRTADALVGTYAYALLDPDLAASRKAQIDRVFATGETVCYEDARNGRILAHTNCPVFDAQGTVTRVAVFVVDITERKQAEEALRTSEERFRRIVETFPGMIWMTTAEPQHRTLFLSDHVAEIFGYPKEEFLSGHLAFTDIIFPEDLQRANAAVAAALAAREPYSVELRFRHRAGHTVWVIEIGAGVYDDAGALQYLIGTVMDITARKQTETALRESEWQYQALFAHMNEGFMLCEIVYDAGGRPVDWIVDQMNPALREMLGWAAASPVGERGSAIFGVAETMALLLPICAHVAETGVPSRFEAELPTLGKHVVASVFSPRIGRFAAVFYDITARKLAEEQVREYQRELLGLASELSQAEERERRRIAADLHDSIIQNLALLQIMLGGLRAQVAPALREAVDEARALLASSIQSARTLTFELSPPVLYELGLIAALEWLGEQIQQRHGLRVAVGVAGHFRLVSDDHRALLFSIVRELLMNAVKHARASQVTISAEAQAGTITVAVTDDGVGFDPAAVEEQRSGYGLFSIRERLRHFGGTLTITSRPGAGTRVELAAPLPSAVPGEVE
ncbi:MAG TPA: PAS domain S-box protein, partial [Armatimonadota bacterium]|nr:PAS domain S-box protein [Armatimonadota bacterium]